MSAYELWHVEVEYTAGVWTDITADVDSMTAPVYATNGTTAEVAGDPGSLTLVLHNVGFKYTPANALSAFALSTGMGIRFFDLIGGNRIYTFTGFVEFPEVASVNVSMNQDQTIQVSAVDQLSLWERSQTFVSTLGAHILGSPGAAGLVAYWPLVGSIEGESAGPVQQGALKRLAIDGAHPTSAPTDLIQFNAGVPPPGEDAAPVLWAPVDAFDTEALKLRCTLLTPITLSTGQFLTLVCWVRSSPDEFAGSGALGEHYVLLEGTSQFDAASLFRDGTSTGGEFKGAIITAAGPWGTNFEGTWAGPDVWHIFAGHYQLAAAQEMWFDATTASSSFGGSPPASVTFTKMTVGSFGINGSIAHVQVYVDSGTFSRTEFLAQREVGLYGLERQTTGDRIRALARYGGQTDAELVEVDPGQSIMSRARLAGLNVAQAMYEARDTEQGDLYIDGTGLTTFADRRTLLNI